MSKEEDAKCNFIHQDALCSTEMISADANGILLKKRSRKGFFLITLHHPLAHRYRMEGDGVAESDEDERFRRSTMTQQQTSSATIYQFPVGGRDGLRTLRDTQRLSIERQPPGGALGAGESWYHAEAIREDKSSH